MNGPFEMPPIAGNGDALATLDTGSKKLTCALTFMGLSGIGDANVDTDAIKGDEIRDQMMRTK